MTIIMSSMKNCWVLFVCCFTLYLQVCNGGRRGVKSHPSSSADYELADDLYEDHHNSKRKSVKSEYYDYGNYDSPSVAITEKHISGPKRSISKRDRHDGLETSKEEYQYYENEYPHDAGAIPATPKFPRSRTKKDLVKFKKRSGNDDDDDDDDDDDKKKKRRRRSVDSQQSPSSLMSPMSSSSGRELKRRAIRYGDVNLLHGGLGDVDEGRKMLQLTDEQPNYLAKDSGPTEDLSSAEDLKSIHSRRATLGQHDAKSDQEKPMDFVASTLVDGLSIGQRHDGLSLAASGDASEFEVGKAYQLTKKQISPSISLSNLKKRSSNSMRFNKAMQFATPDAIIRPGELVGDTLSSLDNSLGDQEVNRRSFIDKGLASSSNPTKSFASSPPQAAATAIYQQQQQQQQPSQQRPLTIRQITNGRPLVDLSQLQKTNQHFLGKRGLPSKSSIPRMLRSDESAKKTLWLDVNDQILHLPINHANANDQHTTRKRETHADKKRNHIVHSSGKFKRKNAGSKKNSKYHSKKGKDKAKKSSQRGMAEGREKRETGKVNSSGRQLKYFANSKRQKRGSKLAGKTDSPLQRSRNNIRKRQAVFNSQKHLAGKAKPEVRSNRKKRSVRKVFADQETIENVDTLDDGEIGEFL